MGRRFGAVYLLLGLFAYFRKRKSPLLARSPAYSTQAKCCWPPKWRIYAVSSPFEEPAGLRPGIFQRAGSFSDVLRPASSVRSGCKRAPTATIALSAEPGDRGAGHMKVNLPTVARPGEGVRAESFKARPLGRNRKRGRSERPQVSFHTTDGAKQADGSRLSSPNEGSSTPGDALERSINRVARWSRASSPDDGRSAVSRFTDITRGNLIP